MTSSVTLGSEREWQRAFCETYELSESERRFFFVCFMVVGSFFLAILATIARYAPEKVFNPTVVTAVFFLLFITALRPTVFISYLDRKANE